MSKPNAVDNFRRRTAQRLRANATAPEVLLWKLVRTIPISGAHFRRQVPIGPYVADFACLAARLVIELDGSQHARREQTVRDAARTDWLEHEGYRVIRFWNSDVVHNSEAVLNSIYLALYGAIDSEAAGLKHKRRRRHVNGMDHPTPARNARRPSPSRGG